MSFISANDLKSEFAKSKIGIVGIGILFVLVLVSVVAIVTIPLETFQEWNNPSEWIDLPKTSIPIWVNVLSTQKIPEHKTIPSPSVIYVHDAKDVRVTTHQFDVDFLYDDFPNDFIYELKSDHTLESSSLSLSSSVLLNFKVIRPDGITLELLSMSIPNSDTNTSFHGRIFSTDDRIKKNLFLQSENFEFSLVGKSAEDIIFSSTKLNTVLKGEYIFLVELYDVSSSYNYDDGYDDGGNNISKLIVGGKAFGMMGTDELRRDLAIGLLWGTPLALFIGISVAVGSVVAGLIYGTYAGYKGRYTDETMMRFNDVIYALPALPFLIILAVTINNSIFLIIGFLMIFGWVGVAKVSRSMALQIKTRGYVDASKIMGQKDSRIIFRHLLPQLLPYAFASIAISVPAAIITEAGLSFLGLGDPTFPTWGQILHDANTYGAASRGLWWWIMPPGIMIALTGLAFVFIGNALDTIANPKLKRQ
jgi:peptide/nickel transport system permease protein